MQLKALWEPTIPSVSHPMLSKSGMQLDIVTTHVMVEYTESQLRDGLGY